MSLEERLAQVIAEEADEYYWSLLTPDEQEPYYRRARVVLEELNLREEWGHSDPNLDEPGQPVEPAAWWGIYPDLTAEEARARAEEAAERHHGRVFRRWVSPWVGVTDQ